MERYEYDEPPIGNDSSEDARNAFRNLKDTELSLPHESRFEVVEATRKKQTLFCGDKHTGEILYLVRRKTPNMAAKRRQEDAEKWLQMRKIRGICDVKNMDDLRALVGWADGYPVTGFGQAADIASEYKWGTRVRRLLLLIQDGLIGLNHTILSNHDVISALDDKSGNYNRHIRVLEEDGVIRVRSLNKSERLITLNPVFGFRGTEAARHEACRRWYSTHS